MNLIAYSDSEESDNDAPPIQKPAAKPAPKPAAKPAPKPAFQKVVDRSNPGTIKLNLPAPSQQPAAGHVDAEAPPAKKARTGEGAFSGFNSFLPAPKKSNAPTGGPTGDSAGDMTSTRKRSLGRGLGSGVNLKTGAEPAFQRRPRATVEYDEDGTPLRNEAKSTLHLAAPKTSTKESIVSEVAEKGPVRKDASTMKFVPLFMARNRKKKPIARPMASATPQAKPPPTQIEAPATESKPTAKPKISLFGAAQEEDVPVKESSTGEYQPFLYGADEEDNDQVPDEAFDEQQAYQAMSSANSRANAGPQDLNSIASELNLTEAEKRRLFGRKGNGIDMSSAKIVEFNTDTEYAHNEMIRQQGETVQHNALKSISGTGKNSIRSLISMATMQKDALEDHFAQGKKNKKEAGNKYGW